jgi:hypothetical protein
MEDLLNSHESIVAENFHLFEIEILNIFGIKIKDKLEEINLKRNAESEFISKIKEQEIAQAELKEQEELKKLGGKTSGVQKKNPLLLRPRKRESL